MPVIPADPELDNTPDTHKHADVETNKATIVAALGAVSHESQTLTAGQRAQARANVDSQRNFVLAQAALNLPNYSKQNTTIHPSVIYSDVPLFGYKYWMAHSPYPANPRPGIAPFPLEAPVVCGSNDGVNWATPPGMRNPIVKIDPVLAHWADPTIVTTPDGYLRCYWIDSNDANANALYCAESQDGINWALLGTAGVVLAVASLSLGSPSVIRLVDDSYVLWTTDIDFKVWRRTSADGLTWSAATECTMPAAQRFYHAAVKENFAGDGYIMIGHRKHDPTRPGDFLSVYVSEDGLTWTGDGASLFDDYITNPKAIAGGGFYRTDFIPRGDGLLDIMASTLVSIGCGDGDNSGDTAGAGNYTRSGVSFIRGVDPAKTNMIMWVVATEDIERKARVGIPFIETNERRTETLDIRLTAGVGKGWYFQYATDFAGLASGAIERVHLSMPEDSIRLAGRMEISGNIGTAAAGAIIVSGTAAPSAVIGQIGSGVCTFNGTVAWALITDQDAPPSPALDRLPVVGDTVVGQTSGASATICFVGDTGRALYVCNPTVRAVFVAGEKLTIDGTTLKAGGVDVTVFAIQSSPAATGIALVAYPYRSTNSDPLKGGYIEIWNTSAATFHGIVKFQSFR